MHILGVHEQVTLSPVRLQCAIGLRSWAPEANLGLHQPTLWAPRWATWRPWWRSRASMG